MNTIKEYTLALQTMSAYINTKHDALTKACEILNYDPTDWINKHETITDDYFALTEHIINKGNKYVEEVMTPKINSMGVPVEVKHGPKLSNSFLVYAIAIVSFIIFNI